MTRIFALLFLVLASSAGMGNPLIETHPAYISSEKLNVTLHSEFAEIDGRFHFRSTAKKNDPAAEAHVHFTVLIWVPSDPKQADDITGSLLRSFLVDKLNWLKDDNRAAWDAAVGLKVSVGERPLEIETYGVLNPRSKGDREMVPRPWIRDGYYLITARVDFQPDWLAENPEIRVQYRQGLRRYSSGKEFHYVPVFLHLPKDQTTEDLSRYAMHLVNSANMPASLGTSKIPTGYSAILPLAHHEAITVKLESKTRND